MAGNSQHSNENLNTSGQKYITLGEIVFTDHPEQYNLLGIGTCLAIFMYDLKKRQYGMAHAMLPTYRDFEYKFRNQSPGRYTDLAIRTLIDMFLMKGSRKSDLNVKLVGGGQIFQDLHMIGERNINMAVKTLKEEQIELVAHDMGSNIGRSVLIFNPDGTMLIRKQNDKILI
jgi:chemotaxis protein CheD